MSATGFSAQSSWLAFAAMSAIISGVVWRVLRKPRRSVDAFYVGNASSSAGNVPRIEMPLFSIAYGLAGFGYIVTATYLPVIAKSAIPGSLLLTVFWPLFGIAAVVGSLFAARVKESTDARLYLVGAYLVQSAGVELSVILHDAVGLMISSILVGLPFTAISFVAMKEVRRIRSSHHARYMGLLTAVFAVGQIMGPPTVGGILRGASSVDAGFQLALGIASTTLIIGAAIFGAMIVLFPARGPSHR
jgi:hypothetical protein